MINVVEFFKTLPQKKCHGCGKEFHEQADCYNNLCENCDDPSR